MISEGSCDTEGWSNDAENSALIHWNKLYFKIYTHIENSFFLTVISNYSSLSVGHYELCRDDIGDLPGSPEHLWLRENANEIG